MLGAGGNDVEAGGVDARMPQKIGQLGDVLFLLVEDPGKEMAQVVGKHLALIHPRRPTKGLHLPPNGHPVDRLSRAGDEDRAAFNAPLGGILQKPLPQRPHEENGARLALALHKGLAPPGGLDGEEGQLAHPDAGGAERLQKQEQAGLFLLLGRAAEALVFGAGELALLGAEGGALPAQRFKTAVRAADGFEEAVERGDRGVDRARGKLLSQNALIREGKRRTEGPFLPKTSEILGGAGVFLNGCGGFFLQKELLLEENQVVFHGFPSLFSPHFTKKR